MSTPGKTILAVEDQADVLDLAMTFLTDEGYQVVAAGSGEEAVRILREGRPIDLVFTDIVMAGLNGFGVARQAIALNPATKVLYTTGYADQLHRNEPLVARGDLLPKPYRLGVLGARVAELLETPPEELNPTLRIAFRRWQQVRADAMPPAETAFLAEEVIGILPFVSIVDAEGGGFRYRSLGAAVADDIGTGLVGRMVGAAVPVEHRRFLVGLYAEANASGRPLYVASVYATPHATVATERLFLPLAARGGDSVAVVQTFDRIDTKASIYEVMKEAPVRRDHIRRIDPGG
jgi:CheY-like chemotaxis protein